MPHCRRIPAVGLVWGRERARRLKNGAANGAEPVGAHPGKIAPRSYAVHCPAGPSKSCLHPLGRERARRVKDDRTLRRAAGKKLRDFPARSWIVKLAITVP